jgi:hypothetical protein
MKHTKRDRLILPEPLDSLIGGTARPRVASCRDHYHQAAPNEVAISGAVVATDMPPCAQLLPTVVASTGAFFTSPHCHDLHLDQAAIPG